MTHGVGALAGAGLGDRLEVEEEEESDADLRFDLPPLIGFGPLFFLFS